MRFMEFGITERQARDVLATVPGWECAARKLGVSVEVTRAWAERLGVEPPAYCPPRQPWRQTITDAQAREAILGPLSLGRAAHELGVSTAALHARARRLGLPTDPAGRAALRASRLAA